MKITNRLMKSSRHVGNQITANGNRPNCNIKLITLAKRNPLAFFLDGRVPKVYQLDKI